ncbi:MAG: ferritin [Fibrobacterales bacterium]
MTNAIMMEALNTQMNEEMKSYFVYVAMAAYFEDNKLPGCAHWMRMQAEEEMMHAWKFYNYIFSRGGKPSYNAFGKVNESFDSMQDVFEKALAHEKYITTTIEGLLKLARKEDDLATESMMRWYIDEQVEEEATVQGILDQISLVDQQANGLYLLDKELGGRTTTAVA